MTTANVQDIGYAFLKTYYQRMHNDPSKLFHLYSNTAELTQINYQVNLNTKTDILPTVKVIGKENISKFYSRNNKMVQDVRVKIDACDFQSTGSSNNGILILAMGEICWSNTPTYRFCQTFVLHPVGNNNKMYDVTNDIIRFIPDILKDIVPESPGSTFSQSTPSNIKKEGSTKETTAKISSSTKEDEDTKKDREKEKEKEREKEKQKEKEKEKDIERERERERERDRRREHKNEERKEDVIGAAKETLVHSKAEKEEEDPVATFTAKETSKSHHNSRISDSNREDMKTVPRSKDDVKDEERKQLMKSESDVPKKMNWASQLTNSDSKIVPNVTTNYTRVPPEPAKTPDRRTPPPNGNSKANSKKTKHISVPNKDGYYPVYIRNTGGVTNKELTDTLEREFGVVKKISAQESFAVIDFEDPHCQQDAIRMHTLKISNTTVYMEPKTEKKRGPPASSISASTSPTSINGSRSNKKHSNRRKD
ncbi:Bre5p Ecym_7006 [Eremothecium cymbalariae DBVPG|uniref:NTF2 domain-containing protein n=1 Tax=Eremothecium cymbalariae (strain CBS 270.75 / DBVPG 7215 / KCTC 17166 / NRRL Y-17582) TaxID=931890 RepID=G8JVJ9_ERECY|nr:hypothetical protein Ecym_7006 [Eremothecium cymbalariae DBVPG\